MKQILSRFLLVLLLLSLTGCAAPAQETEATEAPVVTEAPAPTEPGDPVLSAYREVLLGQEPFIECYAGAAVRLDPETWTLSDEWSRTPIRFALLDLDQDQVPELILWLRNESDYFGGFWVLRYTPDAVRGYEMTYRCFDQLKQDGTFSMSESFNTWGLGRFRFTEEEAVFEYTDYYYALSNDEDGFVEKYFIGNQEATPEDLDNAYAAHREKPDAAWLPFLEEHLIRCGILRESDRVGPTAREKFEEILTGNAPFYSREYERSMTLREFESLYDQGARTRGAYVDLDLDGISELVLEMQGNSGIYGLVVLRDTGCRVEATVHYVKILPELKTDGTYVWELEDGSTGISRTDYPSTSDWSVAYHFVESPDVGGEEAYMAEREFFGLSEDLTDEAAFFQAWELQAQKADAAWFDLSPALLEEQAFAEVLEGGEYFDRDSQTSQTLHAYLDDFSETCGLPVTFPKAAALDMDRDGIKEVVLWLRIGEDNDAGSLVLHFQDGQVQGQTFYHRQLGHLKANGTFHWSGSASDSGEGRLIFAWEKWTVEAFEDPDFDSKEDAPWVDFESAVELFN